MIDKVRSELERILKEENSCHKHSVAVVIATPNGGYIGGWNGAPDGVEHDECLRKSYLSGEGMDFCIGIHAEIRAIDSAGIATKGSVMYMSEWFPCYPCAVEIVKAGISELVTPDEFLEDNKELIPGLREQSYNFEEAYKILIESGIKLTVDERIRPKI